MTSDRRSVHFEIRCGDGSRYGMSYAAPPVLACYAARVQVMRLDMLRTWKALRHYYRRHVRQGRPVAHDAQRA